MSTTAAPTAATTDATPQLELRGVERKYIMGDNVVYALHAVDLQIERGSSVALIGTSGSGKSTMMNILGCLDQPTKGSYLINGRPTTGLSRAELADVRGKMIGFVFQSFNLLSRTNALENVEMPLLYQGVSTKQRRERARAALARVGLGGREDHYINQLSGGQQQRVAIARALVTEAPIIMADEPTGNLDTKTSHDIMGILQGLVAQGKTVILVTHEADIAAYASRVVTLRDGRIIEDHRQTPTPIEAA